MQAGNQVAALQLPDDLHAFALAKTEKALRGPRLKNLQTGLIGLNDFSGCYRTICDYAGLSGRTINVLVLREKAPVLTIAPEATVELPTDAFIHDGIDYLTSRVFISLSLPEPFASQFRDPKNHVSSYRPTAIKNAETRHSGKLLGPSVFWRQRTGGAPVIVAKCGTTAMKPN